MTKALPFTEASLRRAIKAARKEGLSVTGIRYDGTLLLRAGDGPTEPLEDRTMPPDNDQSSRWGDVQA